MRSIILMLSVFMLGGCALNPKFENQTALNGHVVRAKVAGFAKISAVKDSFLASDAWTKYKEMVPDTIAKDDDVLARITTVDGVFFTSDMFKQRFERQLVLLTREELTTNKEIGGIQVGDIIDVRFPDWTHKTRTRDRDIRVFALVCKRKDSECIDAKAKCLGAIHPVTGNICDYKPD